MMRKFTIDVGELLGIICKAKNLRSVSIDEIEILVDSHNQGKRERRQIGAGGVLTLYCDAYQRRENEDG